MDKKTRSKVVSAFINYPEIVLYNLYDGAVDCITGRSIPRGTRIVTTTYATRKKYGIVDENVTIAIQINGKLRGTFEAPLDIEEDKIKEIAMNNENVKKHLTDKEIVKVIVIKNKIINIVVR